MAFAHRLDGLSGVQGWIDEQSARAWAREASRLFASARLASTLSEAKERSRAALRALDEATAALNLPQSQGSGEVLSQRFPFGLDRIDLHSSADSGAEYLAKSALAVATFGSVDAVNVWVMAQPLGDYPQTAPNGERFTVRVFEGLDGAKSWALLPDPAKVLSYRRTMPPSDLELRASAIERDPWAAYVAARERIDATNAQRARWWGLTTPEQIAGFQVASDAVNNALAQEWTNAQRERVRAKFNEITDDIAAKAASTGIGAPIAAVFKAVQLLGGILPWVTEEPPPPAVSRVRSGGTEASTPPRHQVRAAPVAPLELASSVIMSQAASVASTEAGSKGGVLGARSTIARGLVGAPSSQSSASAITAGAEQGASAVAPVAAAPVRSAGSGLAVVGAGAAAVALILFLSRSTR